MKYLLFIYVLFVFASCETKAPTISVELNPAAEGFNLTDSDSSAIALADSIMIASGGRKAWDETQYLKWNFFGSRRHVWNKKTGDLVIFGIRDSFKIKMNINDLSGEVFMDDRYLTKEDSLDQYLQKGKEMWINDAYWVFLPYKLKDSGVTLKKLEKDTMSNGLIAERIQLSFNDVGVTPDNKYIVYLEPTTNLLSQWDFYSKFDDEKIRFSTPWADYKKHGDIFLSGDRGGDYQITEIAVGDSLAHYFD